jgi:DNA-binding transcriptional LysR family regulator
MRLDQLRYLRDISQTNSISKTAGRFFVSPQALSKSMQQLENEIGAPILVRSPFGVTLTPQGEEFLAKLSPFIDEYDSLHEEFLRMESSGDDTNATSMPAIHVHISSVLMAFLLPKAIAQFHTKYPRTVVSVEEVPHDKIFPSLTNGDCDLAFLSVNDEYFYKEWNQAGEKDFHYNLLFSDRLVACVSANSPLAKKETIDHKDIKNHRWTALDVVYRQKAHEIMEKYIERYGASGTDVSIYSGSNIGFHREAVRQMGAIALMPRYVFQTAFNSKHFVAKYMEYASGAIYHTAIYPTSQPHPQLLELTNIIASLV